ncbi:MAG: hypothetical protein RMJ05_10105 [Thermomicrobium sp.]|nr:hypothetical protein [Thermomicrobium sp.]MDW8007060.1 hypothetical protein [Thermomicrobium sp.]
MDDFTQLAQSAGVTGAMVVVFTQVLKAVTGWDGRKALVLTAVVALVLAVLAVLARYGVDPWVRYVQWVWDALQQWLGGLAAATGIYKLNRNQGNGGGT